MAESSLTVKSLVAYEKIRYLILSGAKLPGTRLVLSELEEELGIGRGPIRDALMRLDRSGLVQNVPHKGALVASPPSMSEIRHIYDLRAYLEVKLGHEALKHATEKDLRELEELYEETKNLSQTGENFFAMDRQFHKRLYEISALPHLCIIVQKILESVETYLNLHHYDPSDCTTFVREHKIIIEALREKNAELLESTLRSNILGGLSLIDKAYAGIIAKSA